MKFSQAMIGLPAEGYVEVARAAEAAGFSSVALSDHVVYPEKLESVYPYTPDGKPQYDPKWDFPDPWVTVGAMASATTSLRFLTNVFVLPARNPLLVAKTVGTASRLSGGRVSLGIGAGWMREEFDLLEQRFSARGRRMDEMVEVMRAVWAGGFVEHHGEFYDFDRLEMRPVPPAPVPFLVGGHSEVALRRAARLDGWIGVNYRLDDLEAYCATLAGYREELGTADRPYEIVASPLANPTPDTIERLEAMGVTTLLTSAWMSRGSNAPESVEHALDCVGAYADRWIRPVTA
ncbi:MAG: TIGR03619 family F420-dependent LLM class oxidoreductase [Acidimicrobiales bacterium]